MCLHATFFIETHKHKNESSKAEAEVVLSKNLASLPSSSLEKLFMISLTRCVRKIKKNSPDVRRQAALQAVVVFPWIVV